MPYSEHFAAAAVLLADFRNDIRSLRGLFRVEVAGHLFELPMAHSWQPIPGVSGVEMATLDPAQWPPDADPDSDYHLLRGPGGAHSPGLLRVPQAICLKIIAGHQQYWKETAPSYVDYYPGDVFLCGPGEGHEWQTFEPWRNLVSFSPALIPRSITPPTSPD